MQCAALEGLTRLLVRSLPADQMAQTTNDFTQTAPSPQMAQTFPGGLTPPGASPVGAVKVDKGQLKGEEMAQSAQMAPAVLARFPEGPSIDGRSKVNLLLLLYYS